MPFSVALHGSPRLAAARFVGRISLCDIRNACNQMLDSPDWQPGTPQVLDFGAVRSLDASLDAWHALVDSSRKNQNRFGSNDVAVVTGHPDVVSFAELYAHVFRESGRTFQLLQSRKAAQDWLKATTATVAS